MFFLYFVLCLRKGTQLPFFLSTVSTWSSIHQVCFSVQSREFYGLHSNVKSPVNTDQIVFRGGTCGLLPDQRQISCRAIDTCTSRPQTCMDSFRICNVESFFKKITSPVALASGFTKPSSEGFCARVQGIQEFTLNIVLGDWGRQKEGCSAVILEKFTALLSEHLSSDCLNVQ